VLQSIYPFVASHHFSVNCDNLIFLTNKAGVLQYYRNKRGVQHT